MLARVRESLFAILGDVVEDAAVLDLFSGTGSLGLEALSRGASSVMFFERDRRAAAKLSENVAALDVGDCTKIVRGDALHASRWELGSGDRAEEAKGPWAQIALLDPPYPMFDDIKGRAALIKALDGIVTDVLTPGGVLVLHTHPRVRLEDDLPDGVWNDRRVYGNTALWFMWKSPGEDSQDVSGDDAGPDESGGDQ